MDFFELVNKLKEPGDEGEPPAGIYDDLTASYTSLVEGSEAKVSHLQSELQAKEAEISRLKSQNYDLVMSSGVNLGGDDSSNEDADEASRPTGIDSLFG